MPKLKDGTYAYSGNTAMQKAIQKIGDHGGHTP